MQKRVLKILGIKTLLSLGVLFFFAFGGYAEEIYLKNGDRITGEVIGGYEQYITIKTEVLGTILIDKDLIYEVKSPEEDFKDKKKEAEEWQRELSMGYQKSHGNTRSSSVSLGLLANRKTASDEWTIKGNGHYSSTNSKMDSRKWYGLVRYAFSFWKKWYNFFKIEGDHDFFADIDYRLVPATGVGYWFYDKENSKFMVEGGIGFENTVHRDDTKTSNEITFVPRAFFEERLFGQLKVSQDVTCYAPVESFNDYRLHLETVFTNPINNNLSLRLSLIDDYDADPPQDTKKNDLRIISSLAYSF